MLVRTYIYSHLAAAIFTGLTSYWDRRGFFPAGALGYVFNLGGLSLLCLPIFIGTLLWILFASKVDKRNKFFASVIGVGATIAQIVAAIPMIQ